MEDGWIKLHRVFLHWEWFDDPNTLKLFIYLLLSVNYENKRWRGATVKPGQIITSYQHLANELGLTYEQTRRATAKLKRTGEITYEGTPNYSLITLNKWEMYQSKDTDKSTGRRTDDAQTTHRRRTDDQQLLKKDKKDKKDKKGERKYDSLSKITNKDFEEIAAKYKTSKQFVEVIYDRLVNYCEAKGKRYRNYRAALMNWVSSDVEKIRKEAHDKRSSKSKIAFIKTDE